ncbi:hypothetical protein AB0442_17940 [Kitasatospora sp. NPDC085895]|uniref:hypothetical protein n=1 Tax=Kitasatospora sp. NPDC085895 TaxID=3155057 RepID=UPI00344E74A8
MGYHTEFTGRIEVVPPLNAAERSYLRRFAGSRRMDRDAGPYYVDGPPHRPFDRSGQAGNDDVRDADRPPEGQPGLWCHWEPVEDGSGIEWNGAEKFYFATEWMSYLVDHFLKPGAAAQGHPGFEHFTFDHVLNGTVEAVGEEPGDAWQLLVRDNTVSAIEHDPGEPDRMCETCLRIVESEDTACCVHAETVPVWPA